MTEIPGYVPLASYDDRGDDNSHSAEWKALREAAMNGEIDGFQHGKSKRWLVHKVQADEFLAARRWRPSADVSTIRQSDEIEVLLRIESTLAKTLAKILTLLEEERSLDAIGSGVEFPG